MPEELDELIVINLKQKENKLGFWDVGWLNGSRVVFGVKAGLCLMQRQWRLNNGSSEDGRLYLEGVLRCGDGGG
jgi:hypothetical protein